MSPRSVAVICAMTINSPSDWSSLAGETLTKKETRNSHAVAPESKRMAVT